MYKLLQQLPYTIQTPTYRPSHNSSLMTWHKLRVGCIRRATLTSEASVLFQSQKKGIQINDTSLVGDSPNQCHVLSSCLHPSHLHPISICLQCRMGYLTNVRRSISDQQEPKEGIKKTQAHFFSLISSLAQSRQFFFLL